ncbi:MAG: biotin--[acetyl-CoA-carboxylase] ligase [Planctomycetes bacterium]|nr:biotin--[acetyl-CoA-carboxylase] ligase [Planctomycetota bacterium]
MCFRRVKLADVDVGRLNIDQIVAGTTLRRVARPLQAGPNATVVESATSTNDLAWQHLDAPDADGWVVFAEHQSQGRGRLGRSWAAPRGAGILCSVLLIQPETPMEGPDGGYGARLALAAGVAGHDAVEDATGVAVELKWPNDLMVRGRKLGGILVESRALPHGRAGPDGGAGARGTAYVIGLGLNCLQQGGHFGPDLGDGATSLELLASDPVDRQAVARALLVEIDRWCGGLEEVGTERLRRAWLQRAAPLGQRVRLVHAGRQYSGQVVDLDPTAALVVQLDEGGRRLFDAAQTTILGR